MSVALREETGGSLLVVRLTDKLTKDDYEQFTPAFERMIDEHGKIRLLVEMHDFHGWTAGAFWEDVKFDVKHFAHIERLAFVGDRRWEAGMAVFCKPFTSAKIRFFDRADSDVAFDWVTEGLPHPASP
jgi:hypothetical protein